MAEIYGHRWTSAYGDNPNEGAALTWAKGLGGMTAQHLADGLRACIASSDPWPPTLPEFRAMCLSIPGLPVVRNEMRGGMFSPFTRLMWQSIDAYGYRRASTEQADKIIRDAYELAREHVMRGGELPGEPVAEITEEKHEIKLADADAPARARDALWGKSAAAGPDA